MINDEIKSLLGEDTISEETAVKLAEMLNAAIEARLQEQEEKHALEKSKKDEEIEALKAEKEERDDDIVDLKESINEITARADAHVESMRELVEERIQSSVDAAVAEFVNENKTMFEQLDQFNRMKASFSLIQEAFESNGFVLNENAELDAVKAELNESTKAYDDLLAELDTTKKTLEEAQIDIAFRTATAELTESQREKVKSLSEGVSFEGVEEYNQMLSLIVEQVSNKTTGQETLTEGEESPKTRSPKMQSYLDYIR